MKIKVPEVGESVFEATIAAWHKHDGDTVHQGDLLAELETDKVNVEVNAEADGILSIDADEGQTVAIGNTIGSIDEQAETGSGGAKEERPAEKEEPAKEGKEEKKSGGGQETEAVNPAARKMARARGVNLAEIEGTGPEGRVTVDDILAHAGEKERTGEAAGERKDVAEKATKRTDRTKPAAGAQKEESAKADDDERTTREPMTPIRKRIAERLLAARQQTAMLTTFNETDMSQVQDLRKRYREQFREKHDVDLGIMSFFVKATAEALKEFPEVNARIDGDDIVYHHYYDIGIAVGTEKGLVVPVLRDADSLGFAEIEQTIRVLAEKVRNRKITLAELQGGTFTISNGGIYGSLLSTPILNPPQSAVLGMHVIQQRPVVVDGEIVVRPMMNLALSYDHRIIDGFHAVNFLKRIKEHIEAPEEMLLNL